MTNIVVSATSLTTAKWINSALLAVSALTFCLSAATPVHANPHRIALLGVQFENDNEGYQPATDAERSRMKSVYKAFEKMLTESGKYTFIPVPHSEQQKIEAGQLLGACGGCEFDYGRALKAERVAWIQIQKVSNLILNMNVYIVDVSERRATFSHSVDLRNNTDESWFRGINYLVRNYLLPASHGF